jgi:hypothetical protein
MNDNERDNLWNLLGKARQPEVSPFFTRNVLREIRQARQQPGIIAWLAVRWRVASLFAATAVLALALVTQGINPGDADSSAALIADSSDYDAITNLDELIAYQDTSVWLDTDSY